MHIYLSNEFESKFYAQVMPREKYNNQSVKIFSVTLSLLRIRKKTDDQKIF